MKLELVSFPLCPFVHRSATMLQEKGVPYEVRPVDLKNKPDWFLALSPRGKVPVLLVDGTPLFESAAINEFLDETQPPRLLPDDPIERARQRAWIEVANDLLAGYTTLTKSSSAADFATARTALLAILARFEEAVRGPFFAGETFGLVDAAVAPAAARLGVLERRSSVDLLAPVPRARAWIMRLAERPSVVRAAPADFEAQHLQILRERAGHLARELLPPA